MVGFQRPLLEPSNFRFGHKAAGQSAEEADVPASLVAIRAQA